MEDIAKRGNLLLAARLLKSDGKTLATLDTADAVPHATDVGDAGSLGAPWRDVARGDEDGENVGIVLAERRLSLSKVLQKFIDAVGDGCGFGLEVTVVDPVALDLRHSDICKLADAGSQRLLVRRRNAGAAKQDVRHDWLAGLLRLAAL